MNFPTQMTENIDTASKSFVDANERVLDTLVSVNRRIVDTAVQVADRAPKMELPMAGKFTDKLPTPAETGARYIDFVERAVSVNRDFTAKVVAQLPTGVAVTAKTKTTKAANTKTTKTTKTKRAAKSTK